MPKSDISKKATRAVNAIDKLISNVQKNGKEVIEALKQLGEEKKED